MTSETFPKGSVLGTVSGIFLGILLKAVENFTNQKVYTLLLNVDFIPFMGNVHWPELIEFCFHLIVSMILGLIFYHLSEKWSAGYKLRWLLAASLTLPALLLYFPLSLLAVKEVPSITNWEAVAYWGGGHLLFALSLVQLYPIIKYWK
ncbi:hypothetical protein D3H55_18710 [Bacillus salacetis]|uniref:DUF1440 domain-containing protein n=1 Tax=Bacillus salacetis TaxID=2315464 RepID=A0A3A1QQR6_9BACI|nr:hypothetical protein [Bacillus salacetis]RIW29472.1 hypothetical protein D3H55_18710 [Bacillus salacetis]